MHFKNPFKKTTLNEQTIINNQKILDNIMNLINEETEKNIIIIQEKKPGYKEARQKIDFIREIYKKMNKT